VLLIALEAARHCVQRLLKACILSYLKTQGLARRVKMFQVDVEHPRLFLYPRDLKEWRARNSNNAVQSANAVISKERGYNVLIHIRTKRNEDYDTRQI
jgi:hypothetical protein